MMNINHGEKDSADTAARQLSARAVLKSSSEQWGEARGTQNAASIRLASLRNVQHLNFVVS